MPTPAAPVLVSAHRCNTRAAVEAAVAAGADLVEFDVDRDPDGRLYVGHHEPAGPHVGLDDVLVPLAATGRWAHLDLKFPVAGDGCGEHVEVVERVVDAVGVERVVVTTRDDAVVRAVRAWADVHAPSLRVGLSLGGSHPTLTWAEQVARRWSELRPGARMAACGADVVVAQWAVAALGAASHARRADIPLLVWTVDAPPLLRRWLRPGAAWAVTTNRLDLALDLRGPLPD